MLIAEALLSISLCILLVVVFCLLAVICEDFLVPAVEILIHEFKVPEEVAGVTLLAFGSSAPELVLNTISAMEKSSSLSLNAILGSAMIAFGLIPALCMFSSPFARVRLSTGPILREVSFFCLALAIFVTFIQDGYATTMEAFALVLVYIAYLSLVLGLYIFRRGNSHDDPDADLEDSSLLLTVERSSESLKEAVVVPEDTPNAMTMSTSAMSMSARRGGGGVFTFTHSPLTTHAISGVTTGWKIIRRHGLWLFSHLIPSLQSPPPSLTTPSPTGSGLCASCSFSTSSPSSRSLETRPTMTRALLALAVSVLYVSLLSSLVVLFGQMVARTAGVERGTLGGTVVALGAQIPDMVSSMAMAKSGLTDAALSNAIGSQVINVTLGIGLPLLCNCLLAEGGRFPVLVTGEVNSVSLMTVLLTAVIAAYSLTILPVRRWVMCQCAKAEASLRRSGSTVLFVVFVLAFVMFVWQNEEEPGDKLMNLYLDHHVTDGTDHAAAAAASPPPEIPVIG